MKLFYRKKIASLAVVILCIFVVGTAFASSSSGGHEDGPGSEHTATKHWDYNSKGEKDNTDTYRVLNFAVLAIALFLILRKPASQFLGDRIKSIQEQLADLELSKAEAEKKLAEYNEKLSAFDMEAENIIAQYRRQGEAARDRILKEAESAAAKIEEQARRTIDYEFAEAKRKLESELVEQAIARAEERLSKNINDQDQDKLVEEYLDKVVNK